MSDTKERDDMKQRKPAASRFHVASLHNSEADNEGVGRHSQLDDSIHVAVRGAMGRRKKRDVERGILFFARSQEAATFS
jgi:hypothetical protein